MELTPDIVAIQGILTSVVKNTGDFRKIKYRGGNENKILDVLVELQRFLYLKKYIKNSEINTIFEKPLQEIVLFLVINTEFKLPLELESHLQNIVPQLSKCLLVNVIFGLDLSQIACKIFEKIPIHHTIEFLDEVLPCLKSATLEKRLDSSYWFLQAVADKIIQEEISNNKNLECLEKLVEVSNVILLGLTGLNSDETAGLTAKMIYQHMGFTLLRLFEVLLHCDVGNAILDKFLENILNTCCLVVKSVTIKVFCAWVEIEENNAPLQTVISEKAYLFIEKYNKHRPAKELIGMLATMAKKPKTVTELIQSANTQTIIENVNKNDSNQKRWFEALLTTQVLREKTSMDCVNKWAHLCDDEDVVRLLNLSLHSTEEAKKTVVKCAATLPFEKLQQVCTRHFYSNGFAQVLNENVQPQLLLLFNKIGENFKGLEDALAKEVTLLLLQNPKLVFKYIYSECLKNSFYTTCLNNTFEAIGQIARIEMIGLKMLKEVVQINKPNEQNLGNYMKLFNVLEDVNCFTMDTLLMKILSPMLEEFFVKQKDFDALYFTLQILGGLEKEIVIKEETKNLLDTLFSIMSKCRSKFLEFDNLKYAILTESVEIVTKRCDFNPNSTLLVETIGVDGDDFVEFYKKCLSTGNRHSLLRHLCLELDVTRYAESVSKFVQILPICVKSEWSMIMQEILKMCEFEKVVELLTDTVILLCQVVISQENSESDISHLFNGIKCVIQNFGVIIQEILAKMDETLDNEVVVSKYICRLLRKLPNSVKEETGLPLVNLMSSRSLTSLANDKEFVCLVVAINNPHICKVLAQKMTNQVGVL